MKKFLNFIFLFKTNYKFVVIIRSNYKKDLDFLIFFFYENIFF